MSLSLSNEQVETMLTLQSTEGVITPDSVVSEAMHETSPLHDRFNWDDASEAHLRRLDVARELIRVLRVQIVRGEQTYNVPRFVRDIEKESHEQGYRAVMMVKQENVNETLAKELERGRSMIYRALDIARAREEDLPEGIVMQIENNIAAINGTIGIL